MRRSRRALKAIREHWQDSLETDYRGPASAATSGLILHSRFAERPMNRVTWIRIGIVTAVVGVGTFAIWKAIDPGEAAGKKTAKKTTPAASSDGQPDKQEDTSNGVDPFAAPSSFDSRTIPATYVSPSDQTGGAGDRYNNTQNGTGTEVDPFANRNLLPTGNQGGSAYAGDTATSLAGQQTAGQQTGERYGSPGTGDDYRYQDAGQGSTNTYGSGAAADAYGDYANGTAAGGNPLRNSAGIADAGDAASATQGQFASTSRSSDLYGDDGSGAAVAGGSAVAGDGDSAHDPFATSRREPAQFGGVDSSQSMASSQAGDSTANAADSYFDRYPAGNDSAGSDTAGNGYRDTPLPGSTSSGMANDPPYGETTPRGLDQNAIGQNDTSGYGTAADQNYGTDAAQNNSGYDPRQQQPGPDYYGGSAAGAGANVNNASSRNNTAQGDFDPFAEGVRPGGYGANGYSGTGNPAGAGYANTGVGEPGDELLEGPQSPQVIIQKSAPSEIQVGKPAIFEIVVRNEGDSVAHDVQVHDQVPRGTQLLRTSPIAKEPQRGTLVWNLGHIPPREERIVKMELMPVAEGEIGSVATVHVAASASVRTIATRPDLRLEVSAPQTVMIGENVTLKIKVRNPGTGMAEGIVITERVPPELRHDAGDLLEYEVGQLEPGGTRELELTLTAAKAGRFINALQATGDAGLNAMQESQIEVIAPALQIDMQGPTKRYLERPATYTIGIANPGTAAAKDVELVAYVPQGMEFMEADNYGEYDQQSRVVRWSLEELPAAQQGAVSVKLLPTEAGEHRLLAEGSAQNDLFQRTERALNVEGVAAILFEVVDVNDPIEVGAETTYEIRVLNQGSKVATNIQLEAVTPREMRPIDGEGPTRAHVDGNRITFDPLAKLAPRADTKYRIRAKGLQAGDLRLTVKLMTQEMANPVIKEESTRVYADQ